MVLLILGCFTVSWLPYCIIACTLIFGAWQTQLLLTFYKCTFVLAMANSGLNPVIYAWKNANFRRAFQRMLHCKSPNTHLNSSFTMYLEKQREMQQSTVRRDSHINDTSSTRSSSFDEASNRTRENSINKTTL